MTMACLFDHHGGCARSRLDHGFQIPCVPLVSTTLPPISGLRSIDMDTRILTNGELLNPHL